MRINTYKQRSFYVSVLFISALFLLFAPQNKAVAGSQGVNYSSVHKSHQALCANNVCMGMHSDCAKHCATQPDQHENVPAVIHSQHHFQAFYTHTERTETRHLLEQNHFYNRTSNRAPPAQALLRSIMKRE